MSAQLALLDPPSVPTDTSEQAAEAIRPHRARIYSAIVAYVVSRGQEGTTADEIERDTGYGGSTVRPRLVEATVIGGPLVRCADTRKTRSGRAARVYRGKAFAP